MGEKLFPDVTITEPKIYAYLDTNPQFEGLLKIGFTTRSVIERVKQQYPTKKPGANPYKIVLETSAMKNDGTIFTDHDIHSFLRKLGYSNPSGEWFRCNVKDVMNAIENLKSNDGIFGRNEDFSMRPEQGLAVDKTVSYFIQARESDSSYTPHFLWNAKMRFGKTFTAYQLAKKMGWKKVLVLTFKPAVQNSWETDLLTHKDFYGWQFFSNNNELKVDELDFENPVVCFGSFQDFLGKNSLGGIKVKNEWVHTINWDCVIFDEYHYGAWRENAKELFLSETKGEQNFGIGEGLDYFDEDIMPITTDHYLYLSGTPFRAITSGEFIEEQIFNWTYSDEQNAKKLWDGENNPYEALPKMILMTYKIPESVSRIAASGEYDEFDLNLFFNATGEKENAKFKYKDDVQKWLDLIRGNFLGITIDNLKLGGKKPPMPFSDTRLLKYLSHTFWFLPSVASCYAMANLFKESQNKFYHEYNVVVAAGPAAGIGLKALPPVYKAIDDPMKTKTITLSCGKLTTGVTVKPWTGIFMLRNTTSPETYFQAAFRVQSPWYIKNVDGLHPNEKTIIKEMCYVFDFSLNRALRQIQEYSFKLNYEEENPEKKVAEFIKFLPVLAFDGSSMKQVDAGEILDYAMSGTTATLLARRWESALLVNVDNNTLKGLLNSEEAMKALMNIEGFRSINKDLQTIINKSEKIKKAKKEADENSSKKKQKDLTKEEKEYRSLRKQVQEKLIKFATRIPIFMYLTDFREHTLKDVITKLEPTLFKRVTGLHINDFELLVSLGVFNASLMNDAVYKFKRYEDSSLEYAGLSKHSSDSKVGLFDTVITVEEYVEGI